MTIKYSPKFAPIHLGLRKFVLGDSEFCQKTGFIDKTHRISRSWMGFILCDDIGSSGIIQSESFEKISANLHSKWTHFHIEILKDTRIEAWIISTCLVAQRIPGSVTMTLQKGNLNEKSLNWSNPSTFCRMPIIARTIYNYPLWHEKTLSRKWNGSYVSLFIAWYRDRQFIWGRNAGKSYNRSTMEQKALHSVIPKAPRYTFAENWKIGLDGRLVSWHPSRLLQIFIRFFGDLRCPRTPGSRFPRKPRSGNFKLRKRSLFHWRFISSNVSQHLLLCPIICWISCVWFHNGHTYPNIA